MRNRELGSVANALVASFVSRNNDVDGWWAIGVLARTLRPPDRTVVIDLMTGSSNPDLAHERSGLRLLPATWHLVLEDQLVRQHVRSRPQAAALYLRFVPED